MEINRNQYFLIGMVLLLFGLQLRAVETYVLNEEATRRLAENSGQQASTIAFFQVATGAGARKSIQPPEWIGWCLISVGSVLILHAMAMPKPRD